MYTADGQTQKQQTLLKVGEPSLMMTCIEHDYLQNFNTFENNVAELHNFKLGMNFQTHYRCIFVNHTPMNLFCNVNLIDCFKCSSGTHSVLHFTASENMTTITYVVLLLRRLV